MKSLVIGSALLVAFVSVAQAESSQRHRNSMAQMSQQTRAEKAMAQMQSTDVMVNGRVVGRDPSQAVRSQLANEYFSVWAAGAEGGGDAGGGSSGDAP